MAFAGIHKPGQGYWTRLMSGIGAGLLVLMGGVWVWNEMRGVRIGEVEPIYISATAAVIFIIVFGSMAYYFIGRKPRVVDFMIATEGEMKKVNWSTRREIIGSTWVVIGMTIFIALLCGAFDLVFSFIFQSAGVLEQV